MNKRFFLLMFAFVLLFNPYFVKAETCDQSKLSIDSITLDKKSSNVEEKVKAKVDNGKIVVNLKMKEKGDYAKYKLSIKNDSSDDFHLDSNSIEVDSDYIEYSIDNKILKANQTTDVTLDIKYKEMVPIVELSRGKYNSHSDVVVSFLSDEKVDNPRTGYSGYFIVICLLLVSSLLFYIAKKTKVGTFLLLLGILLIMPFKVIATCGVNLNVDSSIEIDAASTFYLDNNSYDFLIGMTWDDFVRSPYNVDNWQLVNYYFYRKDYTDINHSSYTEHYDDFGDGKLGISTGSGGYGCGPTTNISFNYCIMSSQNQFETADLLIKNGFSYSSYPGIMC